MPAELSPAAPPEAPPKDLLSYELVCKLSELPVGARRCLTLPSSGRVVMLINVGGKVFCMDQACYRALRRHDRFNRWRERQNWATVLTLVSLSYLQTTEAR